MTWENQHLDHENVWDALKESVKSVMKIVANYRDMFAGAKEKLPIRASGKPEAGTIHSWSCDMEGHAKKCVGKMLANCRIKRRNNQMYKVATPSMDDHQFEEEEEEEEEENQSVGDSSTVCSHVVLKCLYLARIGRPDILWSVNKLARAVTKWTKYCDKRLARLISYIHHTSEYRQYCYVGNTAQQCRLGLFQDSDFAGDLEDSKSTSGGVLCFFRKSHVCANKLDVQETDFSFTQFYRS